MAIYDLNTFCYSYKTLNYMFFTIKQVNVIDVCLNNTFTKMYNSFTCEAVESV